MFCDFLLFAFRSCMFYMHIACFDRKGTLEEKHLEEWRTKEELGTLTNVFLVHLSLQTSVAVSVAAASPHTKPDT